LNGRRTAGALLCIVLAGLAGALLSCKSSTPKPPTAGPAVAKPQDQPTDLPIANGYKVTMDYRILRPDNTVIDIGKEPLSFIQGKHDIVTAAIEEAVAGMKAGERKYIHLTPEQVFGPYDENKKITVKREQLRADAKVGGLVKRKNGDKAKIVDLSDSSAVLDFNMHALTGPDLLYDVTILKVERP